MIAWLIIFALVAVIIGCIAACSTITVRKRGPDEGLFSLTIVWPDGRETRWPR